MVCSATSVQVKSVIAAASTGPLRPRLPPRFNPSPAGPVNLWSRCIGLGRRTERGERVALALRSCSSVGPGPCAPGHAISQRSRGAATPTRLQGRRSTQSFQSSPSSTPEWFRTRQARNRRRIAHHNQRSRRPAIRTLAITGRWTPRRTPPQRERRNRVVAADAQRTPDVVAVHDRLTEHRQDRQRRADFRRPDDVLVISADQPTEVDADGLRNLTPGWPDAGRIRSITGSPARSVPGNGRGSRRQFWPLRFRDRRDHDGRRPTKAPGN